MLEKYFASKKVSICQRWLQLILQSQPAKDCVSVRRDKDRFNDPIGFTLERELPALYEKIVLLNDVEAAHKSLENVIKIRAVQDLTPAQVINFIFLLKETVISELMELNISPYTSREVINFNDAIEKCVLLAINIYFTCREDIHELTIAEIKAERDKAILMLDRIYKTSPIDSREK